MQLRAIRTLLLTTPLSQTELLPHCVLYHTALKSLSIFDFLDQNSSPRSIKFSYNDLGQIAKESPKDLAFPEEMYRFSPFNE